MTTSSAGPALSIRSRLVLALVLGLAGLAFTLFAADRASAFATTASCALPGSSFQGADGNQDTPSVAEETLCNEHLLPAASDWQTLSSVINSPDPQTADTMFAGGNKETAPGTWSLIT